MACLEIVCRECRYVYMGNDLLTHCPHCGDIKLVTFFDEDEDYKREEFNND